MSLVLDHARDILLGFVIGYVIASLIESYMHEYVSDTPQRTVKKWLAYPRLFKYLIRTNYSHHVVHHVKTFKQDYVTQFTSDEERQRLDKELEQRGAHGKIIKYSNYAVKLHGSGSLVFVAPLLPAIPVLSYFFNGWVTVSACVALMLPPLLSNYAHPYLHMPHADAIRKAPPLISWLLRTRYFRAMARNHYMHHRYVAGNYNLLLGGDLLRGAYRRSTPKDLEEMKQLGLRID